MTISEVKELIAKGRVEPAIKQCVELTRGTELESMAIAISSQQRKFKKKSLMGTLSTAEERQEEAIITSKLLELLNEYELQEIKSIYHQFSSLNSGMESLEPGVETESVMKEVASITKELEDFEYDEVTTEKKVSKLTRVGNFLKGLSDPESKTGQIIKGIKNGVSIVQDIGKSYNSIAEWVGLPVVPRLLLGTLKTG